jgi:heme A synthase
VTALLLTLHQGLFRAGLLITLAVAGWGFFSWLRKQAASGGFRSTLVMTELLFVLQALVGIGLYLGGRRPHDTLHLLYGVLLIVTLPIAASYTSSHDKRREPLVFGIAALFMTGLAIRALTTA